MNLLKFSNRLEKDPMGNSKLMIRFVFKARSKTDGKEVALKKFNTDKETQGVI